MDLNKYPSGWKCFQAEPGCTLETTDRRKRYQVNEKRTFLKFLTFFSMEYQLHAPEVTSYSKRPPC